MTKAEFAAWTRVTAGSLEEWTLDIIRWYNNKEMLLYLGGESGKFIWIHPDGKLEMGTYEDAIPHIGEACFKITSTEQYPTREAAHFHVYEWGGKQFALGTDGVELGWNR